MMFIELNEEREKEFRQWAIENLPPNIEHWEAYHPVCRDEWVKRGIIPIGDTECSK